MSIRLGLFYPNTPCMQVKSRSIAAENPDLLDLDVHRQVAQAAETIGLDYVFLADHWGSRGPHSRHSGVMDPMLFAPVLAMHLWHRPSICAASRPSTPHGSTPWPSPGWGRRSTS